MSHSIKYEKVGQLDCAILTPKDTNNNVDSVLIWLHGLGDNYQGFSQIFQTILPSNTMAIIPNAPQRPITINGGRKMNAWFNVKTFDRTIKVQEDLEGMLHSKQLIDEIIELQLEKQIKSNRIVIGGFSQGGGMSILTGMQSKHQLGGIICASGFVFGRSNFKDANEMVLEHNINTPLYIFHGDEDNIVNYETFAKQTFDWLENSKKITKRKIYKHLGHRVSDEEVKDLEETLKELLQSVNVNEQCQNCNF
ncbi:hypothetical protein ABK040_000576 [Willaertia magna]